jgi:hypothetical protein
MKLFQEDRQNIGIDLATPTPFLDHIMSNLQFLPEKHKFQERTRCRMTFLDWKKILQDSLSISKILSQQQMFPRDKQSTKQNQSYRKMCPENTKYKVNYLMQKTYQRDKSDIFQSPNLWKTDRQCSSRKKLSQLWIEHCLGSTTCRKKISPRWHKTQEDIWLGEYVIVKDILETER